MSARAELQAVLDRLESQAATLRAALALLPGDGPPPPVAVAPAPGGRTCVDCKQAKPLADYMTGRSGGLYSACRACQGARVSAAKRRKPSSKDEEPEPVRPVVAPVRPVVVVVRQTEDYRRKLPPDRAQLLRERAELRHGRGMFRCLLTRQLQTELNQVATGHVACGALVLVSRIEEHLRQVHNCAATDELIASAFSAVADAA